MSDDVSSNNDDVPTRRSKILLRAQIENVPLRTILVTIFTVALVLVAGEALYRLRAVLLLMLVGGFIALLLNPLVLSLQNWKLPRRGMAVFVVTLVAVLLFTGLAFAFGYPLVNSTTHLAHALPRYISQAEKGKGWIGHLLRHYHVKSWIHKNASKLVTFAKGLSKPALALGKGAVTLLFELFALFAFVVLLLLEGPKIRRSLISMMSPETVTWVSRVGSKIGKSALGFMIGDLAMSLTAGLAVFITLWAVSVPFAFLWALWVALVDFLPQVGGLLAGVPTVLFALVHSLSAGIITGVVFVVYSLLENHVLYPIVMSRTVKINPLTVFIAIIVGAEFGAWVGGIFGGFVGVLLAVPGAATVHVLFAEVWNSTGPSMVTAQGSETVAGETPGE
ncbi:MAG TPA: AI-2E family transporter [Acidimicrobiales bacterium]|nr:AI-2E family transporter [Acidimicrobiales bacterium]